MYKPITFSTDYKMDLKNYIPCLLHTTLRGFAHYNCFIENTKTQHRLTSKNHCFASLNRLQTHYTAILQKSLDK